MRRSSWSAAARRTGRSPSPPGPGRTSSSRGPTDSTAAGRGSIARARFTFGTGRTPSPSPTAPTVPRSCPTPTTGRHALIGRAEQVLHDGRLLRQVLRREHLAPGTFLADTREKRLHVWLPGGDDPQGVEMEASVRTRWLSAGADAGHVRVRRDHLPPRRQPRPARRLRPARSRPRQRPERLGGRGLHLRAGQRPRRSFSGFGHIVRRCTFRDNGQLGFGASYCHDTRIEQCLIERNNTKGYSTGWEAGGLKVALSRRFRL